MKICKFQYLIFIGVLCLLLSGCSSSSDSGAVTPPAVSNANPAGVWEGTFTENGVDTFSLIGIVKDDKVIFISNERGVIYVGTVTVSGTSFTATPTNYVRVSTLFTTANLSGSVTTQSTLSGTFSSSSGITGSLSLTYDPISSSLAITDGNWTETYAGGVIAVSVDSLGAMTGSNTDGCVHLGSVSIIDPAVNIYGVSFNTSSCGPLDGTYVGYGVVSDTVSANDTLIYFVDNSNSIFWGKLTRT